MNSTQQNAIATADAAMRLAGLPTYSELAAKRVDMGCDHVWLAHLQLPDGQASAKCMKCGYEPDPLVPPAQQAAVTDDQITSCALAAGFQYDPASEQYWANDGYVAVKVTAGLKDFARAILALRPQHAACSPGCHAWDGKQCHNDMCTKQAPSRPQQAERCTYCDGTGDVHDQIGEWRGICNCPAGDALRAKATPDHFPDAGKMMLADWEFDLHDDDDGRTWLSIRHPSDAVASVSVRTKIGNGYKTIAAQVLTEFVSAVKSAQQATSEPPRPGAVPMTDEQRQQVFRDAENRMMREANLSWRNAVVECVEAFHRIGITAQGPELWCIHITGPDEIYAAPSKQAAEHMASRHNAAMADYYASNHPNLEFAPSLENVQALVIKWPHDALSHAAEMRDFDWAGWGITAQAGEVAR